MEKVNNLNLKQLLLGRVTRLRYIMRFSICPRVHDESVAEHSFYTVFIGLMLSLDLRARGVPVKIGCVLARCAVHDADEAYSGDFIRMFKYSSPTLKLAIDQAAGQFMKTFGQEIGHDNELQALWLAAKDGTVEGAIVSYSDFLSVVSYVGQELAAGNVVMREQLPELQKFAESFENNPKYEPLAAYREQTRNIIAELVEGKYGLA